MTIYEIMRPIFADRVELGVIEQRGTILSGEDEYVIHIGPLSTKGYPLIDGTRTLDQLEHLLSDHIPPSSIRHAFERLTSRGILEWRFEHENGAVELLNTELPKRLERWRKQFGIEVIEANDYLHPSIPEAGRFCWEKGEVHLFVKPYGQYPYIGPLIVPDETPCFSCLYYRLRANRPDRIFIYKQGQALSYHKPSALKLSPKALEQAENELRQWYQHGQSILIGRVLRIDLETGFDTLHTITKRPQCLECGTGPNTEHPPLIRITRTSSFQKLGTGFRTQSSSDTLDNFRHLIDPLTGIVRRFDRITNGANTFVHAYKAFHPSRLTNYTFDYLKSNLYPPSGGKGRTDSEAQTSALCEAIERYSGIYHGDEYSIKGTYHDMGSQAIEPNKCQLFSEDQYRSRTEWNKNMPHYCHEVPVPFDRDASISWSPLWSFTEKKFKYLPTAYCYLSHNGPGAAYCRADSNGLAAGNTLEEALLQGFLELVERDAVAIWWYNRLIQPSVELQSFNNQYFETLLQHYRTIGREVWLLDLTTDLNIPVFGAVSRSINSGVENIVFGFGAHLDAEIAAMRALTEINQVLPSAEAPGSIQRIAFYSREASSFINWLAEIRISEHSYLSPDQGRQRTYKEFDIWEGDSMHEVLVYCFERASSCGIEILALDQTRSDIGLSVVRVVAPGLRHFWKRWAPGRLYDVPVDMDLLHEKRSEYQLNPIPLSY